MMIDIDKSKRTANKLGDNRYADWLGQSLHLFFHCINSHNGSIDKYTGDGAMVSFSIGTDVERCRNALNCALEISEIVGKILNPRFLSQKYKTMNIRIGIDFGTLRIERIGQDAHPQLIIIGQKANISKELESFGKHLQKIQNSTICVGEDFFLTLPEKDKKLEDGTEIFKLKTSLGYTSERSGKNNYLVYEYLRRILDQ
jgi:adenylate cyclase